MNRILAIVILCGAGAACGHRVSSSRRSGGIFDQSAGQRNLPPFNPDPINESFDDGTQVHTRLLNDLYGHNQRLSAVLKTTQQHIAFGADDAAQKKPFTLVTLFFLHYFNSNTGNQESDLITAFKETFSVSHKPAHVLAGPIHTMLAKFISAVANRIGYVYDLCKDKSDCTSEVAQRDSDETRQCPNYSANVDLHDLALQKVHSEEAVLQFILDVALRGKANIFHSLKPFNFEEFKKDLLEVKSVFELLKSHDYSCYVVNSGTEQAPIS